MQETLQAVEADLLRRPFWLNFSPEIECAYRNALRVHRSHHLVPLWLLGLLIYELYLPVIVRLLPDVAELATIVQLGIVGPILLFALPIVARKGRWVMHILAAMLTLICLGSTMIFACSHGPGAQLLPYTLPTTVICGNLLIPLRFRLAVPFTCANVAPVVLAMLLHAGYQAATLEMAILHVASISGFSLIACRRAEISDRATYLLTTRETLRADILAQTNDRLRTLCDTDGLTGIANRRYFDATLAHLWRDAAASEQPLGMLLMDIDHFKHFNDTYGHQAGDRCLLLVADLLRDLTRDSEDVVARVGGEEFGLLLPRARLAHVQMIGERIRQGVEELSLYLDGKACPVRISVGCASFSPGSDVTPPALIAAADAALYCAKRSGRNCIHPPMAQLMDVD